MRASEWTLQILAPGATWIRNEPRVAPSDLLNDCMQPVLVPLTSLFSPRQLRAYPLVQLKHRTERQRTLLRPVHVWNPVCDMFNPHMALEAGAAVF